MSGKRDFSALSLLTSYLLDAHPNSNASPSFGITTRRTPSSVRIFAIASRAGGLAVDHEGALDRTADLPDPGPQFGAIGVRRVAADGLDLGADREHLAEDLHLLRAVLDPAPEGVLPLEAHEEHEVRWSPMPFFR